MIGMVGWRDGDTWWGISERDAPSEMGMLSRAVDTMRYSSYRSLLGFEKGGGENLRGSFEKRGLDERSKVEAKELLTQRTFGSGDCSGRAGMKGV
jgi:hypothetical protein